MKYTEEQLIEMHDNIEHFTNELHRIYPIVYRKFCEDSLKGKYITLVNTKFSRLFCHIGDIDDAICDKYSGIGHIDLSDNQETFIYYYPDAEKSYHNDLSSKFRLEMLDKHDNYKLDRIYLSRDMKNFAFNMWGGYKISFITKDDFERMKIVAAENLNTIKHDIQNEKDIRHKRYLELKSKFG